MNINQSLLTAEAAGLIGSNGSNAVKRTPNIRRIRQRKQSDCGVACVAMVAGVPYLKAFAAFNFTHDQRQFYTSQKMLVNALKVLGCKVIIKTFRSWNTAHCRAILPVNHRCQRQNYHWVAFDGKHVLDPNPKRAPRQLTLNRYRASGRYLVVYTSNLAVATQRTGDPT